MARIVRGYGGAITKITPFDERGKFIQLFINLDKYFLNKAYKYIPNNDLERHLENWYLFDTYITKNLDSFVIYGGNSPYSYEEVRDILDDIWEQLEYVMNLKVKDKFYEIEKFKVWQGLSTVYAKSAMAYWYDGKTIGLDSISKSDEDKLKRFTKMYDYNKKIHKYYKKKYLYAYNAYTRDITDIKKRHQLLKWRYTYVFSFPNKFIKKEFCDLNKNIYLRDYIDTRNQLLDIKKSTNKNWGIDKTLNEYRDNDINYYCKKLNLRKWIVYTPKNY